MASGGAGLPNLGKGGGRPILTTNPGPRVNAAANRFTKNSSRAARPGQNFNGALYQPNKPLSGQALYKAAVALANAQVNPSIKAISDQMALGNRTAGQAEKDISGYYQGLGNYAQQGNQQLGQINSGLNSQLQNISGDENTQLQGIGQNATGSLQKYTPGDPSLAAPALQSLTQELARQQGLAAQQEGNFRAAGASQGANYQGLGSANLGAFATRGEENLGQVASANYLRQAPLTSKLAALQEQRGALISTDLGKLRQQEVANQFTRQGLGLKQQSVNVTAQNDATRNSLTKQNNLANQGLRTRALNITKQNDLANQSARAAALAEKKGNDAQTQAYRQAALNQRAAQQGAKGAPRPLSPSQQNTLFRNLDEMTTLIGQAQHAGHNEQQIRQALSTGQLQKGFPAQANWMVEAAYELLGYGSITRSTAAAMHNAGLRGGTFRGGPIKVTANFNPKSLAMGAPA